MTILLPRLCEVIHVFRLYVIIKNILVLQKFFFKFLPVAAECDGIHWICCIISSDDNNIDGDDIGDKDDDAD